MKKLFVLLTMCVILSAVAVANAEVKFFESKKVLLQWTIYTVPFELVAEEIAYSYSGMGKGKAVNLQIRASMKRFKSQDACSAMMSLYLQKQTVCVDDGQYFYVQATTMFLVEN